MECIDQLQKLSADKQRYENDLVDYMNKYPQGSAPGLVDVIGEYRHKMEEVMTIMERLNQSSTSG